ncbi:MAG TPA: lysophospholipid acyltransferase family protein [Tepidisphaeraceae bacterium]|jgi:KDO2-lipid IV(A) lauroyltransferase|nr:lysophospholipid acyltransferase family protein [Tepidisphaeraceae bacterium]
MTQTEQAIPIAPLPAARNVHPDAAATGPSALVTNALRTFFFVAARAPWLLRLIRPAGVRLAILFCRPLRDATRANALRIFGKRLSRSEQSGFTRGVVANFYDFVADAGRSAQQTRQSLASRIERVIGEPAYLAQRQRKRGAVLVTAHMGAFEVGLAALRGVESNVHVVFKRDPFPSFERLRAAVRQLLGVHEAPIDDGWPSLVRLRDALLADGVVVMQGDRAMPGQRSQVVPLLHGSVRLPTGPVKLAQLTGSPIVPVFVVRTAGGRYEVHLCEAIEVESPDAVAGGDPVDVALRALANRIETFIAKYPQQWLVLEPAFTEDEQRAD